MSVIEKAAFDATSVGQRRLLHEVSVLLGAIESKNWNEAYVL